MKKLFSIVVLAGMAMLVSAQDVVTKDFYYEDVFLSSSTQTLSVTCHEEPLDSIRWNYLWSDNSTGTSYQFKTSKTGTQSVTVSYSKQDVLTDSVYLTGMETFTIHVQPEPVCSQLSYFSEIYAQNPITLSAQTSGGNSVGWVYSWELNGSKVSSGLSYTMPKNLTAGTYKYSFTATNYAAGSPSATGQEKLFPYTYTVNVYGTPSSTPTIADGAVLSRYSGSSTTFAIESQGGKTTGWTYDWKLNGASVGSGKQYSFTAPVVTKATKYTVTGTATNTLSGGNTDSYTKTYTYTVWVYPAANSSQPSYFGAMYADSTQVLSVSTTGGKDGAWSYVWKLDEVVIPNANASSYAFTPSAQMTGLHYLKVEVRNELGDATATNYSKSYTYAIQVYPSCVVSQVNPANLYFYDNTSYTFTPSAQGGATGKWSYVWKRNNVVVQSGTTLTYKATATLDATSEYATYTVTLTNTVSGMAHPFEHTFTYRMYTYARPSVTKGSAATATFVNETEPLPLEISGGRPSGWKYTWKVDGQTVACNSAVFPYVPQTEGNHVITVSATNSLDNEVTYTSSTYTYNMFVYPELHVAVSGSQNVGLFVGQKDTLKAHISGGDPNGWTFSWYKNNDSTHVFSLDTIIPIVAASPAVDTYTLKAVNHPAGSTLYKTKKVPVVVSVYAYPSTSQVLGYDSVIFAGDQANLGITRNNGNPNGWEYVWSVNGSPVYYTEVCPFQPAQEGDFYIHLDVTNSPQAGVPEERKYTTSYDYHVYAYPQCLFGAKEDVLEIRQYDNTSLSLHSKHSGGDASKWRVRWYEDGVYSGYEEMYKTSSVDATATSERKQTIKVVVENTPEHIARPYRDSVIYTIHNYDRPTSQSVAKVAMDDKWYHGDKVSFSSTCNTDGYPFGWTYSWTKKGSKEVLNNTPNYTIPAVDNTGSSYRVDTYVLDWKNAINDVVGASGQLEYTITVYPEATLPTLDLSDYAQDGDVVQMRDVDAFRLIPVGYKGGNPDGWEFSVDGKVYYRADRIPELSNLLPGLDPRTDLLECRLYCRNKSAMNDGKIWAETLLPVKVRFYHTPMKPEMEMKGNGTTHTYFVRVASFKYEELFDHKYYVRFYDGEQLKSETNTQRWYRYDFAPAEPKATTVWKYEDGFECESDATTGQIVKVGEREMEVSRHNLLGQRVAGSGAGVVIIRTSDGESVSAKKVLIK